jgi:uncharacterized membrane protein (DUF2068 family)
MDAAPARTAPPGAERPQRRRPRLAWELLGCGLHGHALVGTDVVQLSSADAAVAREYDGLRWYRCLRCDSWLPLPPPVNPTRDRMPSREQIAVPLRGKPLRARFVLRAIAIDRLIHFLLIGALAVAVLLFAHDREALRGDWTRIMNRLQGVTGGPLTDTSSGLLHDVDHLFQVPSGRLVFYGLLLAAYAGVNLLEAVGLWYAKRWAEYLAVIEVAALLPIEIHELTIRVSVLKIIALIINLAVVAYLLFVHRLFGIRGGGRVEREERERDTGWTAIDRATIGTELFAAHPVR